MEDQTQGSALSSTYFKVHDNCCTNISCCLICAMTYVTISILIKQNSNRKSLFYNSTNLYNHFRYLQVLIDLRL